jgi:hypothetical protein
MMLVPSCKAQCDGWSSMIAVLAPGHVELSARKHKVPEDTSVRSLLVCLLQATHTSSKCPPAHVDEVGGEGHMHLLPCRLTQALLNLRHVPGDAHTYGAGMQLQPSASQYLHDWQAAPSLQQAELKTSDSCQHSVSLYLPLCRQADQQWPLTLQTPLPVLAHAV